MKAIISYDNVTRIETYPLPKAAVMEAVYNAIIHSNYAALVPIPEYTLHLEDIMVKFTPHMSAKVPKGQNGTLEEKIISVISKNSYITQQQIALTLDCSEHKMLNGLN